jgi:TonB family protein
MKEQLVLQVGSLEETISVRARKADGFVPAGGGTAERVTSVPAQAAKPATLQKPCVVAAEGGQIRQPTKIKDVRPIYPEPAASNGVGEVMTFKATIAIDGSIREVVPMKAENLELSSAAMAAIRQWRFTPTLLNCQPIEVEMSVAVAFQPE